MAGTWRIRYWPALVVLLAGGLAGGMIIDSSLATKASGSMPLSHLQDELAFQVSSPDPAMLNAYWSEPLGYRLVDVRNGLAQVPRMYLVDIPRELTDLPHGKARKELFFSSLLPLILQVNEFIQADHQRIADLQQKHRLGLELYPRDIEWLARLSREYRVPFSKEKVINDLFFNRLLKKVDIIPPSLAMAQAALESGWGTSRFAQLGNALFGERIWASNRGMVPLERGDGENHEIRTFGYMMEAVYGYSLNLNRHYAYRDFRKLRAALKTSDIPISGKILAPALGHYSELGDLYTQKIISVIRGNRLEDFDRAQLEFSPFAPFPRLPQQRPTPQTTTRVALR